MKITYDPAKREATLKDRGLDFEDAALVFAGVTADMETDGTITARGGQSPSDISKAVW